MLMMREHLVTDDIPPGDQEIGFEHRLFLGFELFFILVTTNLNILISTLRFLIINSEFSSCGKNLPVGLRILYSSSCCCDLSHSGQGNHTHISPVAPGQIAAFCFDIPAVHGFRHAAHVSVDLQPETGMFFHNGKHPCKVGNEAGMGWCMISIKVNVRKQQSTFP